MNAWSSPKQTDRLCLFLPREPKTWLDLFFMDEDVCWAPQYIVFQQNFFSFSPHVCKTMEHSGYSLQTRLSRKAQHQTITNKKKKKPARSFPSHVQTYCTRMPQRQTVTAMMNENVKKLARSRKLFFFPCFSMGRPSGRKEHLPRESTVCLQLWLRCKLALT